DRNLLASVLRAEAVHLGPGAILDGLTAEQALAKPHNLPHSIAEIVAHICYWQEWFNGCAVAGFTGIAEHAADGWPPVHADGWDALRTRYLHSIEEAQRIAAESDSLGDPLLPTGVHIPSLAMESRGSGILHAAVHRQPSHGPDHYDASVDGPLATTGRDNYVVGAQEPFGQRRFRAHHKLKTNAMLQHA